jgi:hypothetical protein
MKNKKGIDHLTSIAHTTTFPSSDGSFSRFQCSLRNLLGENFDAEDVRFDEAGQLFFWEEERYGYSVVGSSSMLTRVRMKREFTINPRKPLAEEFERIEHERESFANDCDEIGRAVLAINAAREVSRKLFGDREIEQ